MPKTLERISQHSFLPEHVRSTSTVLDLGGNRGDFTFGLRDRYGYSVVAVEPVPELVEWLREQGATAIHAAVTGMDGEVTLTYDLSQDMTGSVMGSDVVHFLASSQNNEVTVRSVTLATLVQQVGPVSLLKVDIEGAELDMFAQAEADVLQAIDQITVEFHDFWYPELSERTEAAKTRLQALGFHMIRFTPNNKDVLFINKRLGVSSWKLWYVGFWLRNMNGAWRAGRVLLTNARNKLARRRGGA